MLTNLRIRNYALIRDLDVDFSSGLNVLTGETGAGKSILLEALGLVLGDRASMDAITDASQKCVVECQFQVKDHDLKPLFEKLDIDYEDECIIRREISPSGKSRSFVNDTPVVLEILREISLNLIEIHSQHNTLSLNRPTVQLNVLDDWSDITSSLKTYQQEFKAWQAAVRKLEKLRKQHQDDMANRDFIQSQIDELKNLNFQAGEKADLLAELNTLENSEFILRNLSEIDQLLSHEEAGAILAVKEVERKLSRLAELIPEFKDFESRLHSVLIDVSDIATELGKRADSIDVSTERFEEVKERLDMINHLEHKHGVMEDDGLIFVMEEIEGQSSGFIENEELIKDLSKDLESRSKWIRQEAQRISTVRRDAAKALETAVKSSLAETGLEDALFLLQFKTLAEPGPDGIDQVSFRFAAHPSNTPGDLNKIASGGELSRIMLAVKANISSKRLLPSIIFDEIDSGISGHTASQVGKVMQKLGKKMQVISITHQPSIAGFGDAQYLVFKEKELNFIHSKIKKLSDNERVEVLAAMISGGMPSDSSRKTATELLNQDTVS